MPPWENFNGYSHIVHNVRCSCIFSTLDGGERLRHTDLTRMDEFSLYADDKGADALNAGDWEYHFELKCWNYWTTWAYTMYLCMGNSSPAWNHYQEPDRLCMYWGWMNGNARWYPYVKVNGFGYAPANPNAALAQNYQYYGIFRRVGDNFHLYVYSDAARQNLLFSKSLTAPNSKAMRYFYGATADNDGAHLCNYYPSDGDLKVDFTPHSGVSAGGGLYYRRLIENRRGRAA
jgi:hypothetical protein